MIFFYIDHSNFTNIHKYTEYRHRHIIVKKLYGHRVWGPLKGQTIFYISRCSLVHSEHILGTNIPGHNIHKYTEYRHRHIIVKKLCVRLVWGPLKGPKFLNISRCCLVHSEHILGTNSANFLHKKTTINNPRFFFAKICFLIDMFWFLFHRTLKHY